MEKTFEEQRVVSFVVVEHLTFLSVELVCSNCHLAEEVINETLDKASCLSLFNTTRSISFGKRRQKERLVLAAIVKC